MKYLYRLFFAAIAVAASTLQLSAASSSDVPLNYYKSLDGLTGEALKTAAHKLLSSGVSMLTYGSGQGHTWEGFYVTDRRSDNTVIDRYSNEVFYFGTKGASVNGMNIEHSFPKSWWGGENNNAYKDLFNLMPCETSINTSKSNYPMGTVVQMSGIVDNGCTKVGAGADGHKYWEPADKWKGDFARGYMYMATTYQDFQWDNNQAKVILTTGAYPTLNEAAVRTYIRWAMADDVDAIETKRNADVYGIQGNRNPYVDFPNLMHYVWGDSVGTPFNIATTRKAGMGVSGDAEVIYQSTFLGDTGDCTIDIASNPDNLDAIWTNSSSYGWVAKSTSTGDNGVVCHPSSAYLLTPELDLSKYESATLKFEHACKFAASPSAVLSVEVLDSNGKYHPLSVAGWPAGTDWTFINSGDVDLSAYAGEKVKVAFHYTSTASESCTWEIKNVVISGSEGTTQTDPSDDADKVLYSCSFIGDDGGCRINDITRPEELNNIWYLNSTYGWVARASRKADDGSTVCYAAESYLITPSFRISDGKKAYLKFDHACKFAKNPAAVLQVLVLDENGKYHALSGFDWPAGTDWNYVNTGDIDLSAYAGQTVSIAFRYTSTAQEASQWEIKNLSVVETTDFSALLAVDLDDSNAPAEYYSIDGYRVNPASYRGIVIRRQGTKVSKILIR